MELAHHVRLAKSVKICDAVRLQVVTRFHRIGRKVFMKWGSRSAAAFLRMAGLCVVLFTGCCAMAQQSMITVDGDIRLFTVLSALDAAGYHFPSTPVSKVRALRREIHDAVAKNLPENLRDRLMQFYATHKEADAPANEISKYISFALVLDQPPKFGFLWSREKLPPDVLPISDFEPLVKEFYESVHGDRLWTKAQPLIDELAARQQESIMKTIQKTEAYLRLPSSSYLGRHYYIVLDPLGGTPGGSARNYGEDYYLDEGASSHPNLDAIRHQFLHFVFDPMSLKFANRFYKKRSLFEMAASNPNLDSEFKKDFNLFAIECIIRAAELRLKALPDAKVQDELTRHAASGFFLIKHFYEQFQTFERGDQGIREVLGDFVDSIDVEAERKYAASLALVAVPPPATAVKVAKTENEKRLDEAENLISDEKYELAKKIFKQIADSDASLRAKALYGLGVASSLQQNRDDAKKYFEEALAVKDLDSATKAWSHIYLGRLYDLEGDRESAIREYAAAVQTGDETRGAQTAAKRGLEKPFAGGK